MSVLEKEIWQGRAVVGSADSHKLELHKVEPFLCWVHSMTDTAHIAKIKTLGSESYESNDYSYLDLGFL